MWDKNSVLEISGGFQRPCVLAAGAETGLFEALTEGPADAVELAERLDADPRATRILADALAAMELLRKHEDRYEPAPGVEEVLTEKGGENALAMVLHRANCLRAWAELARVVKSGRPADTGPSIRGEEADRESFIQAMDEINRQMAPHLVDAIGPPPFRHLLDLGGGPATWTIAFLRAMPEARATLFDLPPVVPIGRRHVETAGLADRVDFVAGDYMEVDSLPGGADLAWVSAIVHQHSREENRRLFRKVHEALEPHGRILIRDVVMDPNHTSPVGGALFAVNMLANTRGGDTFTFGELEEDLTGSGFSGCSLLRRGDHMDSVVQARR